MKPRHMAILLQAILVLTTMVAWMLIRDEMAAITGLHGLEEVGPLEFLAASWLLAAAMIVIVLVAKKGTGR